ncbi:hypothetical protein [Natrinema pallidum]|uniref:DUF8030 domain-containing protein n=1 Tax=Natrinema pallidum DSM 3751 TaxID=1227495 RepID=L9YHE2_9EURY|nr:hypothetical protein [Natrinema pallidum]ELY73530.1 hypothetical protein C487_17285 [Natrinema pallidum DSM 3751]
MSSEYERQQSRLRDEQTEQPSEAPWADLELAVPNDRSQISIVSLVECVLVELTHEEVGAEYVSANVWGAKRTQFIAIDDVGETFQKRHYDERLGWHESTVSRQAVREDLITRLTRSSSLASDRSHDVPVDGADTFSVKPAQALRRD